MLTAMPFRGKFVHHGKNTIEISCQDTNQYAFFIQTAKPVSREEVLSKMHEPENLDAARMRMRRIVRGHPSIISLSLPEFNYALSSLKVKCWMTWMTKCRP